MTRDARISGILSWLSVPCASMGAFFATIFVSLFAFVFGPFPPPLQEPTTGFLMAFLVVLAGSCVAPRCRLATAAALFLFGALPAAFLQNLQLPSTCIGGLLAIAFVGWWFHPSRGSRSTLWVGLAVSGAVIAFMGVVYAYHVDRPARPDQLPVVLSSQLGASASRVGIFYEYDLGGFIDHQWLWRIDAKPDVVAIITATLKLQSTDSVPRRFWRFAPHYWPRAMPTGAEAFQSPLFSSDQRGPDGKHYFLLHDKIENRAFVWFKDNF